MKRHVFAVVAFVFALVGFYYWSCQSTPETRHDGPAVAVTTPPLRGGANERSEDSPFASCEGRVSSDEGPVGGALVCAQPWDAANPPMCRNADAGGSFAFERLRAGTYQFVASQPGFRAGGVWPREMLTAGSRCTNGKLRLVRGGLRLSGRVADLTGGVIEGAIVSFRAADGELSSAAHSTAEGAFELWVDRNSGLLSAMATGYSRSSLQVAAPADGLEIRLLPASTLSGRVVEDASGAPVAGAVVRSIPVSSVGRRDGSEPTVTRTDADGGFAFEDLGPGSYTLVAESPRGVGRSEGAIAVGLATSVENVVIRTRLVAVVQGRVTEEDSGTPCPAGEVALVDDDTGYSQSSPIRPDGRVEFAVPVRGRFAVQVRCEGHLARSEYPPVDTSETQREHSWLVSAGVSIRGWVTDAGGTKVANADVEATPISGTSRAVLGTRTDETGGFELLGLSEGAYRVRASASGYAEMLRAQEIDAPASDVTLVLEGGGSISGLVADRQGQPVGDVSAVLDPGSPNARWTVSDAEGAFEFDEVAAGNWTVALTDRTRRPWIEADGSVLQKTVAVHNGGTETVVFTIDRPDGVIRGAVVRSNGEPEPGAFVTAVRELAQASTGWEGARSSAALQSGVMVDVDGRFQLRGLGEGNYTVLAQVRGDGGEAMARGVQIGSTIELEITSPAAIAGTIVPPPGVPMPEFYVLQLANQDNGWRHSQSYLGRSDGWSVTKVPAGRYVVSARSAAGSGVTSVDVDQGEREAGVRIVLEGETSIAGRVVALEDGRPLPGFRVVATGADAGIRSLYSFADRRNISRPDGTFRVTSPPSGRVTLHVIPEFLEDRDPTLTQAHLTFDITPGQANDVGEIAIPANRLPAGQTAGDFGFDLAKWDHEVDQATLAATVVAVRAGSEASRAGIRVGDQLVAMDGMKIANNGRYIYEYRKRVPVGTPSEFEFASGLVVRLIARPRAEG